MRPPLVASLLIVGIIGPQSLLAAEENTLIRMACQLIDTLNEPYPTIPGVYILQQDNTEVYSGEEMLTYTTRLPVTDATPATLKVFPEATLEVSGGDFKSVADKLMENSDSAVVEAEHFPGFMYRLDDAYLFEDVPNDIAFVYFADMPAVSGFRVGDLTKYMYCYPAYTVSE